MTSYQDRAHVAWAKSAKSGCQTCLQYPELLTIISDVVELIRKGDSKRSINQLLKYIQAKPHNYKFGATALRKHIKTCLGGI